MTRTNRAAWAAHHRRGDVLRAVVDHADLHRDGLLPTHLPGVAETFRDETDLVATLQLRWHTRLAGRIDRALLDQPADPESAVLTAWRSTASELAGVRMILDRAVADPATDELATALHRAQEKDWALMASMAGAGADGDAVRLGRAFEQRARDGHDLTPAPRHRADTADVPDVTASGSLLGRLRAVLAA